MALLLVLNHENGHIFVKRSNRLFYFFVLLAFLISFLLFLSDFSAPFPSLHGAVAPVEGLCLQPLCRL